jgi:hypothetical protein
MEKSGKIEDGVMDSLLQGFTMRQAKPDSNCEAFDPDLANAYLERVMTPKEQTRYEGHLSECTPCRKQIVALARLIEAEVPELKVAAVAAGAPAAFNGSAVEATRTKTAGEEPANWLSSLKGWLGLMATPRFALAAAAALILAITIPYVLIQNSKVSSGDVAHATAKDGVAEQGSGNTPPASAAQSQNPSNQPANETSQATGNKPVDGKPAPTPPPPGAPATTAGEPGGATSGAAGTAPAKEEAVADENKKNEAAKSTDTASGATAQPPEAAKPQPAPEKRADNSPGYIDPNDAKKVEGDKDTARSTTIKPSNTTTGGSPKDAPVVRPEAPKSGPPAGRSSEAPSKSINAGNRFRPSESNSERASASSSRRVGKKIFWLIDDIWTDENYRSDKAMPIVPLIKDSETYKNTMEKYSELKKFFSAFGPNDRVIVVRKDMAYKLIPQDGNK